MSQIKRPYDVKLIMAITFNNPTVLEKAVVLLEQRYGRIDFRSESFAFVHTDYYEKEMGKPLRKRFFSFEKLMRPEKLVQIKIATNKIEAKFSRNRNRNVNIDPGYIEGSKLVLATTKNYDHRVYLGQGIYGDVHLRFRDGAFRINEWTYPDYRENLALEFFTSVRNKYLQELKGYENFG